MTSSNLRFLDHPAGLHSGSGAPLPLYGVRPAEWDAKLSDLPANAAAHAKLHGFTCKSGNVLLLADDAGALSGAILGLGNDTALASFGAAASALPPNTLWRIEPGSFAQAEAELGFLLGAYKYQTHTQKKTHYAALSHASKHNIVVAGSIMMARELINLPPNLLGPTELAATIELVAQRFHAKCERVQGPSLQARFPALYAVGEGSDRAPEAVILHWQGSKASAKAPLISLCGKGVCFDTGGYNIKPDGSMRLMRKDMGGGAIVLGLASAIMALDLDIRLEVRIGCVENSISGHAMRPSDVLQTRAGLTVEVGNTDAEGRLVLCDLLHEACEAKPNWLIDVATLTGAARVALGPDLPALFCNDHKMAETILKAGEETHDPLWRLPLHERYKSWLETPHADLCNISSKPFAGAITAALFMQHFVQDNTSWAHIDAYAWNESNRPGKPEGGEAQTLMSLLAACTELSKANA